MAEFLGGLEEALTPILDYLTRPRDHGPDGLTACGSGCCEPWEKGQHMERDDPPPLPKVRKRMPYKKKS